MTVLPVVMVVVFWLAVVGQFWWERRGTVQGISRRYRPRPGDTSSQAMSREEKERAALRRRAEQLWWQWFRQEELCSGAAARDLRRLIDDLEQLSYDCAWRPLDQVRGQLRACENARLRGRPRLSLHGSRVYASYPRLDYRRGALIIDGHDGAQDSKPSRLTRTGRNHDA